MSLEHTAIITIIGLSLLIGTSLNPRDVKGMLILSTESFRLRALTLIGENVEFYLIREDSSKKTWEGEKQDGTTIRITQFLNR